MKSSIDGITCTVAIGSIDSTRVFVYYETLKECIYFDKENNKLKSRKSKGSINLSNLLDISTNEEESTFA